MRGRTSTRRGAVKRTSRCRTGGITKLERPTVEAEPEDGWEEDAEGWPRDVPLARVEEDCVVSLHVDIDLSSYAEYSSLGLLQVGVWGLR